MQNSNTEPTSTPKFPTISESAAQDAHEAVAQKIEEPPPVCNRDGFFDTLFELVGVNEAAGDDAEGTPAVVDEVLNLLRPLGTPPNSFKFNFNQENLAVSYALLTAKRVLI